MFRIRSAQSTITKQAINSLAKPYLPRPFIAVPARLQSTATLPKISDRIKHDHDELEQYYNQIITSNDYDTKVRYQNQFIWELARHSIAEEIIVYPAFEKYIPDGKLMADRDRAEHLEVIISLPSNPSNLPTYPLTKYHRCTRSKPSSTTSKT